MSARRPVLTPDHPAPGAAAHRQAGYPFSLAGTTPSDRHPPVAGVVIWLAACGGAALLIATPARSGRAVAASLGPATGLLSDGDVSAQLVCRIADVRRLSTFALACISSTVSKSANSSVWP
jgi:hypothetical protein